MAVLAYTIDFNTLVWMNTGMFRHIKIYSEVSDDNFHFEQVAILITADTAEISVWRSDGYTDRQMAFQLYIVYSMYVCNIRIHQYV